MNQQQKKYDLFEFIKQHVNREGIKNIMFAYVDEETKMRFVYSEVSEDENGTIIRKMVKAIAEIPEPEIENPNQLKLFPANEIQGK